MREIIPPNVFGVIAGILTLGVIGSYIYSTITGGTKPNLSTWILYSLSTGMIFFSSRSLGVRETLWLPGVQFIGFLIITPLCIKYGITKINQVDSVCIFLSLISFVVWMITSEPRTALYANILIDAFGSIALIYKLIRNPGTESKIVWSIGTVAGISNILAITRWTPEQFLFPLYILLLNVIVLTLCFSRKNYSKLSIKSR